MRNAKRKRKTVTDDNVKAYANKVFQTVIVVTGNCKLAEEKYKEVIDRRLTEVIDTSQGGE